jgi:MoxR-like ATPase
MLEAIRSPQPAVLLVDEVDRVDTETEALFLEVLAEHQVSVPELGRLVARHVPLVFLTSNNTRDLSEALKRRCLFLYLDYRPRSGSGRSPSTRSLASRGNSWNGSSASWRPCAA